MNKKKNEKLIYETDWLASDPIFYNLKTNKASKKINEIISLDNNFKFHFEGLYNYLNYGYSVYEQTPIKDIKFLAPASQLIQNSEGKLYVKNLPDPIEKWLDYKLKEDDIIELVRERVQKWEKSLPKDQTIILPLSGGFDSRLLLWSLKDKQRIQAFTYGVSYNQSNSTEVVYAKALADHYNLNWKQISLGDFHNYIDDWDQEFGISTHAHGMYHLEFYEKIYQTIKRECSYLSGIFGDVWAGNISKVNIQSSKDLSKLSYSHGLHADPNKIKNLANKNKFTSLSDYFWKNNKRNLFDHRYQIIHTIRHKIILISYLMRLPRKFGFKTWSPFLDIDVAMAMLNLPQDRRKDRIWQKEFFNKVGLDLENKNLKTNYTNILDIQATINQPLKPLDEKILKDFFDEKYLDWINKNIILGFFNRLKLRLIKIPKIEGILLMFGFKRFVKAYSAYMCLKPIEMFLKKIK